MDAELQATWCFLNIWPSIYNSLITGVYAVRIYLRYMMIYEIGILGAYASADSYTHMAMHI